MDSMRSFRQVVFYARWLGVNTLATGHWLQWLGTTRDAVRRTASGGKPGHSSSATYEVDGKWRVFLWLMAGFLMVTTVTLYWPATGHDFVNYDDKEYVLENTHVTGELTWDNVCWAFGSAYAGNWHPVTWISHMLDCEMFGLNPWGHHLTNVLLHALNAVLVFALLQKLTGAASRSLFVAMLFAVHPLRVESVAWVAERKDVLSGFFGLLALLAYAGYGQARETRSQAPEGQERREPIFAGGYGLDYGLALFFFAIGLMSKPMLVTWPLVMLLLDYWPLERFRRNSVWQLVTEKTPFFALAALASVVTFVVQQHEGAVKTVQYLSVGARSGNALVSYCRYLGKLFWPVDLAVFYPHPGLWPLATVLMSGGLILGISVLVLVNRRRAPFLLVGWLWFIGMLLPVIGLVQVGDQALADRYTYLPSLGVLILAIWGTYEGVKSRRCLVIALVMAGAVATVLCMVLTRHQLGYWQDSEALFRHALDVTQDNFLAHAGLGTALAQKGQIEEAISQDQEALRLAPNFPDARYNLGNALDRKGRTEEAISQFQKVIRLQPNNARAHNNLGFALVKQGRIEKAISQYEAALRINPFYALARYNLGNAFYRQGRDDEAIGQYEEVIRLIPDYADAHNDLGLALYRKGRAGEAISQFQEALRLKPDDATARQNLDIVLATKTNSLQQLPATSKP
jgi:tetratricopeptide (TPR) repeat protein